MYAIWWVSTECVLPVRAFVYVPCSDVCVFVPVPTTRTIAAAATAASQRAPHIFVIHIKQQRIFLLLKQFLAAVCAFAVAVVALCGGKTIPKEVIIKKDVHSVGWYIRRCHCDDSVCMLAAVLLTLYIVIILVFAKG